MKSKITPDHPATIYRWIAVFICLMLIVLISYASYAQQRLTYGVELGLGSTHVYYKNEYSVSQFFATDEGFTSVNYDHIYYTRQQMTVGGGAYVRYQINPAWYVQSGLNYVIDWDRASYWRSEDEGFFKGNSHGHAATSTLNYQLHQVEVPLIAGIRFYERWRLYAGPTWGVIVTARRENEQYEERTPALSLDRLLTNVRIGLGVDLQRVSLDLTFQRTLHNTSSWQVADDPFGGGPFDPQVGGNNLRIKRAVLTVGYRLY